MKLYLIISLAVGLAIGFALGYFPIKSDFSDYKLAQEKELAAANERFRQLEQKLSVQKDETINFIFKELEQTSSLQHNIRDTVNELHYYINSSNTRYTSSNNTCKSEREAIRECNRLLGEGADLLEEGSRLLKENALRHDSLINSLH